MHPYYLPIQEQYQWITQLIRQAELCSKESVRGTLAIYRKKDRFEYYHQDAGKRKYLSKKEDSLIRVLAQKEYAQKFLSRAYPLRKELETLEITNTARSASFLYKPLADVYTAQSEPRRQLILPYVLPDREFIDQWQKEPYQGGSFDPNDIIIIKTERGERVRSKSEKIIADKYRVLGIPYRYEYPVYLRGLGNVYCDFTLLDMQERAEVRHEHLGMMQKGSYILKNLRKIDAYCKNGYAVGREILYSFESDEHVLDMEALETLIRSRFF